MDIKGKCLIFPEKKIVNQDGSEFRPVKASISSKKEDGYINYSMEMRFNKEVFPDEKLLKLDPAYCYTMEVEEGWLGVREYYYNNESKKCLFIFVNKGHLIPNSQKIITKKENDELTDEDLPF